MIWGIIIVVVGVVVAGIVIYQAVFEKKSKLIDIADERGRTRRREIS